MLYYILQIIAFQLVFLLIYDLFLRKETFFNWNRIYLIGTALLSFVLPFLKFETFKAMVPENFVIRLPEVIIGEVTPIQNTTDLVLQSGVATQDVSLSIWEIIFYSGVVLATLMFLFKLGKLYWLKSNNPKRWKGHVLLVNLLNSSAAFSFFNTIFIGERIAHSEQPTVLKHELVHVEQKHTLDLLFFEVLRIAMWFNPLVYMYQARIKTLHEYIADAIAVKQNGKQEYYQSLLNQVFETQNLSFTNTFFTSSLIKKRIAMLQKSKSNQKNLLKYVLLIPFVFGMLIYTSLDVRAQEKEVEEISETLVVDQELTYEELVKKYLDEIKKRVENGERHIDFSEDYRPSGYAYKISKDDHAKSNAYVTYVFSQSKDNEENNELIKMLKNYDEYLEWLETDEAKQRWEGNARDGVQRLFVEDFSNKAKEEQARFDKKLKLLQEDDYWHTLIVTDGKFRAEFTPDANENKDNNNSGNDDVVLEEVSESIEVPFSVIENPPTFKECETSESAKERRDCLSSGISKFVNKNFNTDLAKELGLSGRQRISVFFKVGKDGNIHSIGARAPHPDIEDEAKRVISLLPQLVPGTQKGKVATVPYSLPILFQVQDTSPSSKGISKEEFDGLRKEQWDSRNPDPSVVPFAHIDKAPTFESCINLSEKERKTCTSNTVAKFVNKNFNTGLASSLGLTGRQRISVIFQIDKDGMIKNADARAAHPDLEEESKRVVMSLPKMIPGEHKGKTVTTSFSLPILFQVNTSTKDKN
ncbi:M56 family metallopeptidase [Winogradskyella sp. A3E31]|uniref:M56 family metallopeptidase n=1 Tax=Winogradskyella sp. A3E31 TaxID=3349637 RepID=UPI00398A651E